MFMENIKEYVATKKATLKDYFFSLKEAPTLVIVQVNDDEGSNAYIRGKIKDCREVGVKAILEKYPLTTTEEQLLKEVDRLNNDDTVTAFIVQMPLPKGIDQEKVKAKISQYKDVDGFSPLSPLIPATPRGIIEFLKDDKTSRYYSNNGFIFKGKNAVILGRSNIVGKPLHKALLDLDMNVINLHSKTTDEDRRFYLEHADLVVVAIGKALYLNKTFNLKSDARFKS